MTKTIQDLRMKFNQEIKILVSTQGSVKVELKNPGAQLGNSKESLTSRMNLAVDQISGLKKVVNLD